MNWTMSSCHVWAKVIRSVKWLNLISVVLLKQLVKNSQKNYHHWRAKQFIIIKTVNMCYIDTRFDNICIRYMIWVYDISSMVKNVKCTRIDVLCDFVYDKRSTGPLRHQICAIYPVKICNVPSVLCKHMVLLQIPSAITTIVLISHISFVCFFAGFLQIHELFPLTAADSGCQKCSLFCRFSAGCSNSPDHLWRGCSRSRTCPVVNYLAGSVHHCMQVRIVVRVLICRLYFYLNRTRTSFETVIIFLPMHFSCYLRLYLPPPASGRLFLISTWCFVLSSCYGSSWLISTTCPTTGRAMHTDMRPETSSHSSFSTEQWVERKKNPSFYYFVFIHYNIP